LASRIFSTTPSAWFEEYEKLLRQCEIADVPSHIWNADEYGVQDVFEEKQAVGESGKPFYQVKASEKGETTTVLPVFNATGTVGALMVISKS